MNLLFIGFLLSVDDHQGLGDADPDSSVQTQRFAESVVRSLESAGAAVSLLSTPPATSFPHNRTLLYRSGNFLFHGVDGLLVGFINLPAVKHLTRTINALRLGPRWFKSHDIDLVLVHGVHSPWLLFARYCAWRFGVPVAAILTDPPNVPHNYDSRFTRGLKVIDQRVVRQLLANFSGVIAVTQFLARDYAPGVPSLVMEGITPDNFAQAPLSSRTAQKVPVAVYAGTLREGSGLRQLLQAHAMNPDSFVLRVAGRGELSSLVELEARNRPNLDFAGMLSPNEIEDLYANADVLVNPRPPGQSFTRYSFPSKLLEYLSTGKPVISTRLEGIPVEYSGLVVWAECTPEGLLHAIQGVVAQTPQERSVKGLRGRQFALQSRGGIGQGQRMMAFLTGLVTPTGRRSTIAFALVDLRRAVGARAMARTNQSVFESSRDKVVENTSARIAAGSTKPK